MTNNVLPENIRKEDGHGSAPGNPSHVDTGLDQPTTPADTQPVSAASLPLPTGAATAANQLPDNHQVTVSNQIAQPLTDAQLRATPVPVSGTVTTTPSGTQDVNVVSSTEIEVTLNGEPVELWRGGSQADALFVQWNGSQQVTVQGSVQVVTQGASSLSVDAAQDGAWSVSVDNFPTSQTVDGTVSVDNFPTEYPLPAAQVSTLTPQTDALTNAELRAAPVAVENLAQLVPEQYDEVVLSYTGDDLTGVVYKNAAATVATLTLGYTGGKLTSVVRS